jgi:putative nucleotidyltransferase with HDIG domain
MRTIRNKNDAESHIRQSLGDSENVMPSLPQVLVRVQKAIQDGGMGARELASVILEDPSLTASVLRLANSAFYRHSKMKIRTITSAIVLLGFETIRNLALGLSVFNMLNNLPRAQNYREVWRHSLCCAVCAQNFGHRMKLAVPEEAFVAGLLHDMGKLILGQFFPEHYAKVIETVEKTAVSPVRAEQQIIMLSHMEAGAMIAHHWSFPDEIVEAIGMHEFECYPGGGEASAPPLVRAVMVANKVAHFMFHDVSSKSALDIPDIQQMCTKILRIEAENIEHTLILLKEQVRDIGHMLDIVFDDWRFDPDAAPAGAVEGAGGVSRAQHRLNFLLGISELAAAAQDFPDFMKTTIENVFSILDLNYAFLLFHNSETGFLEAKLGYGADVKIFQDQIKVRLNSADDVAAAAFLEKRQVSASPENLHRFTRLADHNIITLLGTMNVAAAPIILEGKTRAVLVVSRAYDCDNIEGDDLRLLSAYAQNCAAVIARTRRTGVSEIHRRRKDESG